MNTYPDAAYSIIIDGVKILRHHNKNVKSGKDNDSVEPKLLKFAINALKLLVVLNSDEKEQVLAHLLAHAKALDISVDPRMIGIKTDAAWTTKNINDLPDSSFAVVEHGGSKDSSGKTEPRSYRHLPYKDASGKVDLPHLRNALARMNQINAVSPKDTTARIRAVAKRVLVAAAKKYLPNSKFAKGSENLLSTAKLANVEMRGQKKLYFITMDLTTEDGLDYNYQTAVEVYYDADGKPTGVALWDSMFPVDCLADLTQFLNNLPKA